MKPTEYILQHQGEVLLYLKSKFPMYHLSNFFFRDVHYGIRMLLEEKGMKLGYTESELIARRFVEQLEKEKIFTPIDRQSWVVRYPEFKTPPAKPAAAAQPKPAARPAAPAPAVPGSATAQPAEGSAAGTASAATAAAETGSGGDTPGSSSTQAKP